MVCGHSACRRLVAHVAPSPLCSLPNLLSATASTNRPGARQARLVALSLRLSELSDYLGLSVCSGRPYRLSDEFTAKPCAARLKSLVIAQYAQMATRNVRPDADAVALRARVRRCLCDTSRRHTSRKRRLRCASRARAHHLLMGHLRCAEATATCLLRLRQLRLLCVAHCCAGLSLSNQRLAGIPDTALLRWYLACCHACRCVGNPHPGVCAFMNMTQPCVAATLLFHLPVQSGCCSNLHTPAFSPPNTC